MITYHCDGCFEELDRSGDYIACDEFCRTDDEDDDSYSPENDSDYQMLFHGWTCIWMRAGREVMGEVESEVEE